MSTRDRKLALAMGLASGILGLGAAAAGAETDPAFEASNRGSESAPPVVESTTTTVTLPPETTTTVTSAPAPPMAQESPPAVEAAPPAVEQVGQEQVPAVVEPVQAPAPPPRPAPAPSRPVPVLARTGDGGQALSILAGTALALGGAAIAASAGARGRRS